MKGLIRKDLYMMKTYFRISWVIVLIFLVVGAVNEKASFYYIYSCMMGGILPISLLSYDEKERWMDYADTLPVSTNTIVRSKYLLGLIFSVAVSVLATISYAIGCKVSRGGDLSGVPGMAVTFFCISLLPAILLMPVIFKFGVEKGRVLYYILFGMLFFFAALTGFSDQFSAPALSLHPLIAVVVFAALWVGSLLFSQIMYPRRER